MAYTPNNIQVFLSAFEGALSGMAAFGRGITSAISTTYDPISTAAGAYAQQFDTSWGAASADSNQLALIEECSKGIWDARSTRSNVPTNYLKDVLAVIALVSSGESFMTGQGIVPPGPPTTTTVRQNWRQPAIGGAPAAINVNPLSDYGIPFLGLAAPATVNLPANPTAGDTYAFKIEDSASASQTVTINGNGHNVESATAPGTTAATFVLNSAGENYIVTFLDNVWRIT